MINERKEIKSGILLSYSLIFVNTIYGLLVTPYILRYVGDSAYGVYKSVSSISASLAVMDLGLGTTMTRYMAIYHATEEKDKAENFAGMLLVQFLVLAVVVFILGMIALVFLPSFYGNTFSDGELILARELLFILVLNIILRMFENVLFGILSGNERFRFSNSLKLINVILKFALIMILLPLVKNVKLVVLSETLLVTATIVIFVIYIVSVLHIVPKLKRWDSVLFKESFGYTLLMFIQSVTIQFNGNIDNVLIGAQQGSIFVTIYSMALAVFGMYENLSGSVANIMLPKITKHVVGGSNSTDLQKTVEKAGRYQFMLLAAALGGFIVLGRDFYKLWLGDSFLDCYYLVLILIIPVTFPMMQNVALSILRAENKMVYRTITLIISCICNIIITFVGIKFFGYWGAAFGTAFATILNLIMMNVYYHKILSFNIMQLFFNIAKGILPAATVATVLTFIAYTVFYGTWFSFVVNAIIFLTIYGIGLLLFGLKKEEKITILGRLERRKK